MFSMYLTNHKRRYTMFEAIEEVIYMFLVNLLTWKSCQFVIVERLSMRYVV